MSKRLSQLDKVIGSFETEICEHEQQIAVLKHAVQKMRSERISAKVRTQRPLMATAKGTA